MASIPSEISAGITLSLSLSLPEYPAPDWSLSLVLRGPQAIDLTASAEGEDHVLEAAAADTAEWAPGLYVWQLRAIDAPDVVLVEEGQSRILVDLAAQAADYDGRSHAERVLEAIEAVIEGRASIDQSSYSINNRSLSRTPIGDLLKLRTRYRAEVAQARARRSGRCFIRQHKVRFS